MLSPDEQGWTDEDFMPQDQGDPIETLRQYIRQRLHEGVPEHTIADELAGQGLDQAYLIELIHSVRTLGQYRELEVGTELLVNGVSAGFFKNPVFEKKRRLARRQQRREREVSDKSKEATSALDLGSAHYAQAVVRESHRRERSVRLFVFIAGAAVLLSILTFIVLMVLAALR